MELGFTYTARWHELQQSGAEYEAWKSARVKVNDRWRRKLQMNAQTCEAWAEYTAVGLPEAPTPPAPVWEPAQPLQ